MSTTNFTGHSQKLEGIFCLAELSERIHIPLICLSVVNIIFALTATMGNTLIVIALQRETSLHPPSKVLFRNLAVTDLCVGIVSQPFQIAFFLTLWYKSHQMCRYTHAASRTASTILCGVSMLTTTAVSVDRLLALLLRLRYRQVVTLKRIYGAVIAFWAFSTFTAATLHWNNDVWLVLVISSTSLCLVTSICCYSKIFLTLRRYQNQVRDNTQEQASQIFPPSIMKRYRQTVYSGMYVQLALVSCYLPFLLVWPFKYRENVIRIRQSVAFYLAVESTVTLLYFNSSLNPILYCWKIKEVRQAVKDNLRQLFRSSNQQLRKDTENNTASAECR
ncbi:trace amine-associated receptor 9-like [Montipora capricornis]|uniref:trace amine-associated receptor 9-like n=1 Tax=Montipora capricornis TaxID=246305 RepID=UPI0035F1912C